MKVRTPEPLDILSPVIGRELALAVVAHREGKGTAKPFDVYRANITLQMFLRSTNPRLAAWEYVNREINRKNPSQEYVKACVNYDPDTGVFTARLPARNREEGDTLGSIGNHGYLNVTIAGKSYLAHRLAWFYVNGQWPAVVDHIDRDRHNNRIANLRQCTLLENAWNVTPLKGTKSGVVGVNWFASRNKWVAKISGGGKYRTLGYFDSIEAAAQARADAVQAMRGHFLGQEGGL